MNSTSTICDVKMSLNHVLALSDKGGSSDKAQQKEMKKDFDKASSSLDTALEAMLQEGSADKAKLSQFKDAWASFKKTHKAENVPATQYWRSDRTTEVKFYDAGGQCENHERHHQWVGW